MRTRLTEEMRVDWELGDFIYPWGKTPTSPHMFRDCHLDYVTVRKVTDVDGKVTYSWDGRATGPRDNIRLHHDYLVVATGDFSAVKEIFDMLGWEFPTRNP
ncbi:hypothetical protein QEH42_gp308 [Microbacterium phage Pumpernickel]|uniref:Uncharacterized protein n=1 Tax=Microbacterium phage Pumpernickel TaxID=2885983 RepID=A0AAE8Y7H2_9CAUD|nr:hypothetical protein QEH42_gp308 [Microbacterium phage Pumpernickel]UDL15910.1 hypothetical protein SEA_PUMPERNICKEL_132 [Microbacterium phage Pumpernickel]